MGFPDAFEEGWRGGWNQKTTTKPHQKKSDRNRSVTKNVFSWRCLFFTPSHHIDHHHLRVCFSTLLLARLTDYWFDEYGLRGLNDAEHELRSSAPFDIAYLGAVSRLICFITDVCSILLHALGDFFHSALFDSSLLLDIIKTRRKTRSNDLLPTGSWGTRMILCLTPNISSLYGWNFFFAVSFICLFWGLALDKFFRLPYEKLAFFFYFHSECTAVHRLDTAVALRFSDLLAKVPLTGQISWRVQDGKDAMESMVGVYRLEETWRSWWS